jgi:hypothetical protein
VPVPGTPIADVRGEEGAATFNGVQFAVRVLQHTEPAANGTEQGTLRAVLRFAPGEYARFVALLNGRGQVGPLELASGAGYEAVLQAVARNDVAPGDQSSARAEWALLEPSAAS